MITQPLQTKKIFVLPTREKQLLDLVRPGNLIRAKTYPEQGYEWLTCANFDNIDNPPRAEISLIEQVQGTTNIRVYGSAIKYLQFDEAGARFSHLHINDTQLKPSDDNWGRYYDLLRRNEKWEGSLVLGDIN